MKRLIVCCDGTWQQLSSSFPTNVVKLAQIIKPTANDGKTQILYYQPGIGTDNQFAEIPSGYFGWGIDQKIQEAYRFLSLNYEENDEIYLFGFSRGAYTARSLAGFIYCSGLLRRENIRLLPDAYKLYRDRQLLPSSPEAKEYRKQYGENVPIKLLGCWDTVGALGIPNIIPLVSGWVNAKYKFHDTQVNRMIENALHAVAVDERRGVYNVTPMRISSGALTKLRQVWFPGGHGCVGGGEKKTQGLSDAALLWMINETQNLGLGLEFVDHPETAAEEGIRPDYAIAFDHQVKGLGLIDRNIINPDHDPTDQTILDQNFFDQNIHLSIKKRWQLTVNPLYRPQNLIPYQKFFDKFED